MVLRNQSPTPIPNTNDSETTVTDNPDNATTEDDNPSTANSPTAERRDKCNAYGQLKTGRYSAREKPPLPKRKYRKRKGSTQPTRFSKRIIKQNKRKVDQVYELYLLTCLFTVSEVDKISTYVHNVYFTFTSTR